MTAFGRSQKEDSDYAVTVEVRTLNSKNLDTVLRLPKNFLEFEDPLRKLVVQQLKRGRTEIFIQMEATRVELKASRLNLEVADFYWDQLRQLHRRLEGSDAPTLGHLLRIPHIFEPQEMTAERGSLLSLVMEAAREALSEVQSMRVVEGRALCDDCTNGLARLRTDLDIIVGRKDTAVAEYSKRLRERVQALLGEIPLDESRFMQEVASMAEKMDINEEIVRLRSHFDQFESLLTGTEEAVGRKLDFLTQEIHRETNTIGSKTGDLETTQTLVRMKNEIARLKEQIQNIE